MKRMKIILSFIAVVLVFVSTSVKAELSTEDYNRLRNVFSDARISTMTEDEINKYLGYDLENAVTKSVYYEGTTKNNDSYTWKEISEEEYNAAGDVMPYSTYFGTAYKEINISAIEGAGSYSFFLRASWKWMPATRSFDVIAFRFRNVAVINGSQGGTQIYKKIGNSSYDYVTYSPNGTNISKQDNGFGISMNLVDDDIDYLELNLDGEGIISGSDPYVYGSYQHATSKVTLAQSQSYTISGAGYGGVINFPTSIQSKYDGMSGVYQSLS